MKTLWRKLHRPQYLARLWDELTPELRRKHFVGDSFTSFKLWRKLIPKEQELIKSKVHYKSDAERITKALRKAGYMKGTKKMVVSYATSFNLDIDRRMDPKKVARSIKVLREEIADYIASVNFDKDRKRTTSNATAVVKVTARK